MPAAVAPMLTVMMPSLSSWYWAFLIWVMLTMPVRFVASRPLHR